MFLLVAFAALALVASSAAADHCEGYSTSPAEVDGFGFYVAIDICQICDWTTVWVYQESNLLDGLQRGDEIVDDTCHGVIPSDRIVF